MFAHLKSLWFRWTNRVVELDGNTTAKFESTKITNRCTVLYKVTRILMTMLENS